MPSQLRLVSCHLSCITEGRLMVPLPAAPMQMNHIVTAILLFSIFHLPNNPVACLSITPLLDVENLAYSYLDKFSMKIFTVKKIREPPAN